MIKHPDFHDFVVVGEPPRGSREPEPGRAASRPLDLATAFEYMRRRLRLVLECVVIGGGLSAAAGLLVGPSFTATALLAVAETEGGAQAQANDTAVDTQIAMLQSQAFLERAFAAVSADPALSAAASSVSGLERRLKVMQASKSRLVAVSFSAKSAALAADVANRIVRLYVEDPVLQSVQSVDDVTLQYAARIQELEAQLALLSKAAPGDANAHLVAMERLREQIATLKLNQNLVQRRQQSRRQTLAMTPPVQLVALATPPARRSSLNPLFIIAPGTLFSALFGVGLALTLGRLDKRIYTREQLENLAGCKCAGEIPALRAHRPARKKASREPGIAYARALEAIVTQTVLLSSPRPRLVMLAASEAQESAAQMVRDFAAAAARVAPRVLLIDLDFSRAPPRPSLLRRVLGRSADEEKRDVFDVLAGRRAAFEAIEREGPKGYSLLPLRSPIVDDPFSLIASERLGRLLDNLCDSYDLILVASPPLAGMHEAQILAACADTAVIFVRCGASQESSVLPAFSAASRCLGLNTGGARPRLWAALTDAPEEKRLADFVPAALAALPHGAGERPTEPSKPPHPFPPPSISSAGAGGERSLP